MNSEKTIEPDVEKCKICRKSISWDQWVIDGGMCIECRRRNWKPWDNETGDIW